MTPLSKILSQNTKNFKLSYVRNLKSLSHLVSKLYRVVTDGQTETELP